MFVSHDLSRLTTVTPYQTLEEARCCSSITLGLKIHIYHLAVLIHCSLQVMLFAIDLYEYFVNEESVAVASVRSLQSACINGTELDTQ